MNRFFPLSGLEDKHGAFCRFPVWRMNTVILQMAGAASPLFSSCFGNLNGYYAPAFALFSLLQNRNFGFYDIFLILFAKRQIYDIIKMLSFLSHLQLLHPRCGESLCCGGARFHFFKRNERMFQSMNFQFLAQQTEKNHTHLDVELLYVINGSVEFYIEEKKYSLEKDDYLIVNIDTLHRAWVDGDALACRMEIPFLELNRLTSRNTFTFLCNSAVESGESYELARDLIRRIIWEEYQNNGKDKIYIASLYYQLLHILVNDFLIDNEKAGSAGQEHKFDERKQQIEDYIRQNYNGDISLQQLADKLYLSVAYLSKYIKKQFGMSFIEYVNTLRFNIAVSQLLYSDKSVLRIAMDTGFSSSATLNKMFRDRYHKTPTEFRAEWRDKDTKRTTTVEEERAVREKVNKFFEQNPAERPSRDKSNHETVVLTNTSCHTRLEKTWSRMINMGTAADLLKSNVQKHMLTLASMLNIKYVRFWDLYAEEMFLVDKDQHGFYNFDNLDRLIDFLIDNNLKPYIELGNKPKLLIKNSKVMFMYNPNAERVKKDEIASFIEKMIVHLINRYTPEEVETWYFEFWKEEPKQGEDGIYQYRSQNREYVDLFERLYEILHRYVPNCNFGGAGFSLRFGEKTLVDVLRLWNEAKYRPDFISMYNYPYSSETFAGKRTQSLDRHFFRDHLAQVREVLKREGYGDKPLHVTEWSFSVSNRNMLNDHCMNGAYVMKNAIDCAGMCDMMGYWVGSDLYSNYYDTSLLLNGGSGLLSKDGIPKPSCYAFEFLNRLGRYVLQKGDYYLITSNSGQSFRIVCHNLKDLSYQYSRRYEDEITLESCDNMFTDMKRRHIHFELPVSNTNDYFVRVYTVNRRFGSVQDEWSEMLAPAEMRLEDLRYLNRITTPKMYIQKCEKRNGYVIVDSDLEPNEIMFMHVMRKY